MQAASHRPCPAQDDALLIRGLIDRHSRLRGILGEMTGADDPGLRQNAAWLLSQ